MSVCMVSSLIYSLRLSKSFVHLFYIIFLFATCLVFFQGEGICEPTSGKTLAANRIPEIASLDPRAAEHWTQYAQQVRRCHVAEARILRLSPRLRLAAIKKLEPGIYVDVPEFWKNEKDPDAVMHALRFFGEPLNTSMLDALQRIQPQFPDESTRRKSAALLYRYGRAEGYNYLKQAVIQRNDDTCAAVFAMNHDTKMTRYLIANAAKAPPYGSILIDALAEWHSPEIATGLWSAFQSNPSSYALVIALAAQNYYPALPRIKQIYATIPATGSDSMELRIATEIFIAKLDKSDNGQILQQLLQQLKSAYDSKVASYQTIYSIQSLGRAQVLSAVVPLARILRLLFQQSLISQDPSTQVQQHYQLLATVALALAQLSDKSDKDIIEKLLVRLVRVDQTGYYTGQVAQAVLDLGGSHAILTNIMGENWLRHQITDRTRRPIVDGFRLDVSLKTYDNIDEDQK